MLYLGKYSLKKSIFCDLFDFFFEKKNHWFKSLDLNLPTLFHNVYVYTWFMTQGEPI